jgi:hypothetical protein
MAARKRTTPKIYELYVELEGVQPPIWRRLLVLASIRLHKLHELLQLTMGWTNSHLHSFQIGERAFSMSGADLDELDMLDEKKFTLEAVLGESIRRFSYEYDFGDSWRHQIKVKPVAKPNIDWSYPLCIGGARAAPPDDVGGVYGYAEFLSAIKDPKHDEHDQMLAWVGGVFDPEGFDLNAINRALRFGAL